MLPYDESIAITGVSGRYPSCNNIQELEEAILAGKDLVTNDHDRWGHECLETTPRMGMVPDWAYFDAGFFGINPKEANVDDPKLRKLLEVVYEAVVDAGLNPSDLRGTRTGVFLAVTQNCYLDTRYRGGIAGRSISIYANMVSFAFDFKGPSYGLDSVCASGLYAFTQAMDALLLDRCSTAIVCSAQTQFDPAESMELIKIGVLHHEGICRSFSVNRKGYVKSEACVAVVLQRVEDSKRIYATVLGSGTNIDGFKVEGLANPSALMQRTLLEDVCTKFDIDPLEVNYVEAHATGTKVGDIAELKSIDEFFCKTREKPLLIGCVKSNVGHSEGTSGLVSLSKVIIAIQGGIIPRNIYYDEPDPEMTGIIDGRLKVIEKNTPLPNGLIAINAMGFGGTNGSIFIRPYTRKNQIVNNLSHRLVHVSGRTEEAVQLMLDKIIENKTNEELLSLMDNIHNKPIDGHNYRGYAILSETCHTEINQGSFKNRPLWYVFSGVGSQWPKMGRDLMKIDLFKNTMQRCANALTQYGIDLEDLVMNGTEEVYDNLINTYIGITSVSVALVDVLNAMNIVPDGIIGHSLGEIGCAYIEGLITPEQAVLIAYARGYSIISSDLPPGLMAAVGMSIEECSKILPKDVYIACDNSEDNITISGAEQAVRDFLEQLTSMGIFNREINSSHKPLHSPLLSSAGPKVYDFLKKVLPEVRPRSKKWLPSAVPEEEWESELGRFHSAEYHHHNFLNPVHFKQLLKYIPKDALVLEISPRGLLQGILRRSLDNGVTLLPLVKPGADNFDFFLSSIGKFYINGGKLDLRNFYKTVNFPVGVGTPTISNWIKWDHRTKWDVPRFNHQSAFGSRMEMDTSTDYEFMEGHVNDGRMIVPAMGYVFLAWKALAKMLGRPYMKLPVVFENVKALRPTLLPKNDVTAFIVNIFQSTGYFEICLENELEPFATGRVYPANQEELEPQSPVEINPHKMVECDDFYQHMHMRGFDYGGIFMGVQQISLDGRLAKIKWNDNWIAFMDTVVHSVLAMRETGYCLPSKFEKIVINPQQHLKSFDEESNFIRTHDKTSGVVRCGGLEITHIGVSHVKRHVSQIPPTTGKYTFVPNICTQTETDNLLHSLHVCFQIMLENTTENLNIKVAATGFNEAIDIIKTFKEQTMNLKKATFKQIPALGDIVDDDLDFLVTQNVGEDELDALYRSTTKSRFVFAKIQNVELTDVDVIFEEATSSGKYVLIRKYQSIPDDHTVIVTNNENFSWAEDLKMAAKMYNTPNSRIYLVNEDFNSGVVGLFSCVRHEQNIPNLRVFLVRGDNKIERFSTRSKFYMDQLKKDLTVNVYQDGEWGTYKCLPLKPFVPTLQSSARLLKTRNGINWVQKSPYCCNKEIEVQFASLTRWDVAAVNDLDEERLGLEYSGIDKNGNNVMGVVEKCALATSVQAHPQLVWTFPDKFSFKEAATIPLAYTLSYYSLFLRRTQLTSNDSILVHHCTSDISLAAIVLALNKGCKVFVVVDPQTYQNFVREANSKSERVTIIVDTKTNPFHQTIMKKTGGKGMNFIFNSKTPELLQQSMKCIAKNGKVVEIDSGISDYTIADEVVDKNCCYYNATLTEIFQEKPEVLSKLASGIDKYLKEGHIVPLSATVFDKYDIKNAVKFLENTNFSNKCLIQIKEKNGFFAKPESRVLALPRTYFDPKKSYVVIGGLGGFGMELSNWLVERGATKIVLNGRRDVYNGYQALYLQKWKNSGVTVLTDTSDSSTMEGAVSLLQHASNLAPVGGIFNAALVVKDMLVVDQTVEDFIAVAEPKIFSCQNIDIASRQLCKKLDHFVFFSSVASSLGNAIQSSYGFVNSAMERLCEVRKAEGLPSLVVQWAPLGDVGFVARMKTKVKIIDAIPQATYSCLEVVDKFMQQDEPIVFSCVYGDEKDEVNEERTLIQSIALLFGIKDVEAVDSFVSLSDLGMDSLLGFEIKHMLTKECGQEFSVNEIRNMTIEMIKSMSS